MSIPESSECVQVCIIDTTTSITGFPMGVILAPADIPGWEVQFVDFAFLIEHASGRTLLFDLGLRKDFENSTPAAVAMFSVAEVGVQKDVPEILQEHGIELDEIEALIPSHWHFEHWGHAGKYPPSATMIVGPGFKEAMLPGCPENPDSMVHTSDFTGREVRELTFNTGLKVLGFDALDYFGDGSFYLLDTPGHAVGHLGALARTTADPPTYMLLLGDCVHHAGELRPSAAQPLPVEISPNPLDPRTAVPCPSEVFLRVHPTGSATEPFFHCPDPPVVAVATHDPVKNKETVRLCTAADARDDVFVVMAHDSSLLGVVELFPKTANAWKAQGWGERGRWAFLREFKDAVARDGEAAKA